MVPCPSFPFPAINLSVAKVALYAKSTADWGLGMPLRLSLSLGRYYSGLFCFVVYLHFICSLNSTRRRCRENALRFYLHFCSLALFLPSARPGYYFVTALVSSASKSPTWCGFNVISYNNPLFCFVHSAFLLRLVRVPNHSNDPEVLPSAWHFVFSRTRDTTAQQISPLLFIAA